MRVWVPGNQVLWCPCVLGWGINLSVLEGVWGGERLSYPFLYPTAGSS